MNVRIQKQTQAERDEYLFECFHDSGILPELVDNSYSIIAGRKGSGKTALARYLQQKYEEYELFGAVRISVNSFTAVSSKSPEETKEKLLLFVLLKACAYVYNQGLLSKSSQPYWEKIFKITGIQDFTEFLDFEVNKKTAKISFMAGLLSGHMQEHQERCTIEIDSERLFHALLESVEQHAPCLIFIDDLTDYLDALDKDQMYPELQVVKEILFRFDLFNTQLADQSKSLRFISCIRDDLFEFMEGSNINKLKSNSLFLTWNEKSFASLLIRRLPYFQDRLEAALENPIEAIREYFPDEIFRERLLSFNTKRHATNFYTYMVAISFNRPRDFLRFCYAMRHRLSERHPATMENIDSAEIEYTDYFMTEIRDELFLASKIFEFNFTDTHIYKIVDILARKDAFNPSELRTEVANLLEVKTKIGKSKIEKYVYEQW